MAGVLWVLGYVVIVWQVDWKEEVASAEKRLAEEDEDADGDVYTKLEDSMET